MDKGKNVTILQIGLVNEIFHNFQIPANSVTALDQSLTMIVDGKATALAYLWETTPVIGTEALPIYADDEFRLPGAPWWTPLNF